MDDKNSGEKEPLSKVGRASSGSITRTFLGEGTAAVGILGKDFHTEQQLAKAENILKAGDAPTEGSFRTD